ncbi:hypothetical protein GCM10025792_01020 [Pseudonocardia tropica]
MPRGGFGGNGPSVSHASTDRSSPCLRRAQVGKDCGAPDEVSSAYHEDRRLGRIDCQGSGWAAAFARGSVRPVEGT